jgi:hypothetical protein
VSDESWRDDPVAAKTGWGPARKGGSHESMQESAGRITLQPTALARAFVRGFPVVGAGVLAWGFLWGFDGRASWVPWLAGIAFVAVGPFLARFVRPFTLDADLGLYWAGTGDRPPHRVRVSDARSGRLDDVHAVQIVSETVRSNEGGTYDSHEINLVLTHGRRVNVCDHGHLAGTRTDAARIPLWDAAD